MSKMFDNYDNLKYKCCRKCPEHHIHLEPPAILQGWSGSEAIFDYDCNEIGVGFNQGSPINLLFYFGGTILDDWGANIDIDDFISASTITFELLNYKHDVVYSTEFEGRSEDYAMAIKLGQEVVNLLLPGIYYIKMTLHYGLEDYILFKPQDALIHIS